MSNLATQQYFNPDQIALIKSTLMVPGKDGPVPTDNDLALFGFVCKVTELSPFNKQIFAIQRKGKWTFQISIDGYRAIASRTGSYAGSDEPLYDEDLSLYEFLQTKRPVPSVCKVTVWKIVQGVRCPFVGVAPYQDFLQSYQGKPTETWGKMPLVMLAKCAETQALRKAFPQCAATEQSIEQVAESGNSDDWRVAGYEWGISQGVPPNIALEIMKVATSKENLHQRLRSAIPVIEAESVN